MTHGLGKFLLGAALLHGALLLAWQPVLVPTLPEAARALRLTLLPAANAPEADELPARAPDRAVTSARHAVVARAARESAPTPIQDAAPRPPLADAAPALAYAAPGDVNKAPGAALRPEPDAALSGSQLAQRLETDLRRQLAPYFSYPALARRRGWQGDVHVGLRVEPDGRLSALRIVQSSGHFSLDEAALDTLRQVAALPQAHEWLHGRSLDMVLPIAYRLVDD